MSDLSRLNEAVAPLVERARAGDEAGFEELVRQCHQQIYRWALVQTGDADDAEDVAQEVLVRVHAGVHRYEARSRFTTWLFQITRNTAAQFHRRHKSRERALERHRALELVEAESGSQTEAAPGSTLVHVIRGLLHNLPPSQREVFDLVDLQDHAPIEVSEMLGMNPVTVRVHLLRARRAIRERILQRHPDLVEDYRQ